MKFSSRARLLLLSSALALAGPAAVVTTASPAHAVSLTGPVYYTWAPPHISALGGPAEIWVYGYNFPAGARVRVEALSDPGLQGLDTPQWTTASGAGVIGVELYDLNSGPAWVAADYPGGTTWARTVVQPPPGFLADTGQPSCGLQYINVDAYGFMPGYDVEVELLTPGGIPLAGTIESVKADGSGRVHTVLIPDYGLYVSPAGDLQLVAGEYGDGPLGLGPAPATASTWVYVC